MVLANRLEARIFGIDRIQRRQAGAARGAALGAAALALALAGCASETPARPRSGAAASATWEAPIPAIRPLSLANSLSIIRSARATGPTSLEVAEASAASFAFGNDHLNPRHPEWKQLVAKVCGPDGLLKQALAAGWNVTVTGFVDSTGPLGRGTVNDRLQVGRAKQAAAQLISTCRIPRGRVLTRKGGVGGAGAIGRRITVTYTREPTPGKS